MVPGKPDTPTATAAAELVKFDPAKHAWVAVDGSMAKIMAVKSSKVPKENATVLDMQLTESGTELSVKIDKESLRIVDDVTKDKSDKDLEEALKKVFRRGNKIGVAGSDGLAENAAVFVYEHALNKEEAPDCSKAITNTKGEPLEGAWLKAWMEMDQQAKQKFAEDWKNNDDTYLVVSAKASEDSEEKTQLSLQKENGADLIEVTYNKQTQKIEPEAAFGENAKIVGELVEGGLITIGEGEAPKSPAEQAKDEFVENPVAATYVVVDDKDTVLFSF